MTLRETLFSLRDETYRNFTAALLPTCGKERILGVRLPELRRLAAAFSPEEAQAFLRTLPHTYHEEDLLHALLINRIRTLPECITALEEFLPFVSDWAVCDSIRPKAIARRAPEALAWVLGCLSSEWEYKVRFGIEMLMSYYLDENFSPALCDAVCKVQREEYYIHMMRAWYFATALAKQYDTALRVLTERRLDALTHNKTIQKAVESRRIDEKQKAYLKTLKIR